LTPKQRVYPRASALKVEVTGFGPCETAAATRVLRRNDRPDGSVAGAISLTYLSEITGELAATSVAATDEPRPIKLR
jgi:hypothetical protein